MKNLLLMVFVTISCISVAQTNSIIPAPVFYQQTTGQFILNKNTVVVINDEGERKSANFLRDYIETYYQLKIGIVKRVNTPATNYILLNTKRFVKAPDKPEQYSQLITPGAIQIEGDSYAGTFYGMQTFLQQLPLTPSKEIRISCTAITDYPRFGYRGMHLDVSRHFFPAAYIKKYIDLLALHKMNAFHWHLTDDQGWRIEIKKYPLLTSIGGYRNGTIIGRYPGKGNDGLRYGGFYTQAEIREIINYAADRYIDVIPEIEMPGHSSAAIAAYPELSCFPAEDTKHPAGTAWNGTTKGKQVQQAWGVFPDVYCAGRENTFTMLEEVLDEVSALFPSTYVHIGGDECPKANWKRCPRCQQRIKDEKLKDENELQAYFIKRIEMYVNSKGKQIIGWDEILDGGLAPNATVMSWRGEQGGIAAAKQKHNAIMTPESHLYFNWSQNKMEDSVSFGHYTPLEKVYAYEPIPKGMDSTVAKYILGAQANLWTEYIKNTSILEYNLLPRLNAISEVLWSAKKDRDYKHFEPRVITQMKRYDLWKTNYSKGAFSVKYTVKPTADYHGLSISFQDFPYKNYVHVYTGDQQKNELTFKDSIIIKSDGPYYVATGKHKTPVDSLPITPPFASHTKLQFAFNKATGKKIVLKDQPSGGYPGNVGAFGMVNGLTGKDFNSAEFLGWSGKNLDASIDLGNVQQVSTVKVHVWKQEPSWFYLPRAVEIYTSRDGMVWQKIVEQTNEKKPWPNERIITVQLPKATSTRFIKIVAINHGVIAKGNAGEGKMAWLFADEIVIE